MRPRTEAALAVALVAGLVALAAAVGASRRDASEEDLRASSFFSGPLGARGLADALRQSGVAVSASRRRLDELEHDTSREGRRLIVQLDPADPMSGAEQMLFLDWFSSAPASDLLLAGAGASRLMACFGHLVDRRPHESVALLPIAGQESAHSEWPRLSAVLSASTRSVIIDSSRAEDAGITSCVVPPIARIDTLLTSSAGRVVAQRLWLEGRDQRILLLSDATLARNRAMRETPSGPFVLGLMARDYDQVVFDELHQGFGLGGSLFTALMGWSVQSPWGWAVWQLAVVGLLLLLVGALRFGPVRHVIVRKRRSPLEHVKALATALAAARGHDVAIGAILRGLHRRLHPAARLGRTEWRAWVDRLAGQLRSPRAQEALRTLQSLTRPGQPSDGVLQAANAVEDVWQELRP